MVRDPAIAHGDHPRHRGVGLGAAPAASNRAAAKDDDVVAGDPEVIAVWAQHVPDIGDLLEVGANARVPFIAAAFYADSGEREELDLRVIEIEQSVDVPAADRLEAVAHDLDVLLHCTQYLARTPARAMSARPDSKPGELVLRMRATKDR